MSDNFGERMAKLEEQVIGLKQNVKDGFESVNKKMDDFIEAANDKYATKESSWGERVWLVVFTAIGLALIAALLGQVIIR